MIGVIVQARTGSSRFPRKIYEDINGKTTLERVMEGVSHAMLPNKIILAMPLYDSGDFFKKENIGGFKYEAIAGPRFNTYFGSENDLIERFFQAARLHGLSLIVRVTADCPLIQGDIIDNMLTEYFRKGYNGYMSNIIHTAAVPYPSGMDVEIFPYWMLAEVYSLETNKFSREHVGPSFYGPNRVAPYNLYGYSNISPNRVIVNPFDNFSFDTPEDLELIKKITKHYDVHGDLNKALDDAKNGR